MTKPQAAFLTFLLRHTAHYIAKKQNYKGRPGYMIYLPKQQPQKWFPRHAVRCFVKDKILKVDGVDFYKADRKKIRSMHGRTWIKRIYRLTLLEESAI